MDVIELSVAETEIFFEFTVGIYKFAAVNSCN